MIFSFLQKLIWCPKDDGLSVILNTQCVFYNINYYLLKIIQSFDWLRAVDKIVISVR